MNAVKMIHDESAYTEALQRIENIMDAEEGTPESDELELLSYLVATYEDKAFPIEVPDAITAIRFIMEQREYTQKDFAALIGKSRASELLNGKREISMAQARTLYSEWGIPPEILLSA